MRRSHHKLLFHLIPAPGHPRRGTDRGNARRASIRALGAWRGLIPRQDARAGRPGGVAHRLGACQPFLGLLGDFEEQCFEFGPRVVFRM